MNKSILSESNVSSIVQCLSAEDVNFIVTKKDSIHMERVCTSLKVNNTIRNRNKIYTMYHRSLKTEKKLVSSTIEREKIFLE